MTQTEDTHIAVQPTGETSQKIEAAPQISKPLIQLWYHEADFKLLEPINPYFTHLFRRLGRQVGSGIFGYADLKAPKIYEGASEYLTEAYAKEKAEHEKVKEDYHQRHRAAIADLARTVLFVPCISPTFMEALDRDLAFTPELAQVLEQPGFQIMPIIVRPTETGEASPSRPLSTYAEGDARATALKELVALMERMLCDTLQIEPRKTGLDFVFRSPRTIQPLIASQKTTMDLVLEALEPVKDLMAQASTQIVEARQLALAERSEHQMVEALAQEVKALRQQIQTQPSGWWSRFRKKQS